MHKFNRREFIVASIALCGAALEAKYLGSRGGEKSAWNPEIQPLAVGQSFDLSTTLPSNLKKGGVFSVDPSGKPLPKEINLDKSGVLTVQPLDTNKTQYTVEGVIFSYNEPS